MAVRAKKAKKARECPILVYPEKCAGCRMCQVTCSIRYLDEFNPLRSFIVITRDHGARTSSIKFTDDCTWCGQCARFCNYGALILKQKAKSAEEGI
jgi:ferredoxin